VLSSVGFTTIMLSLIVGINKKFTHTRPHMNTRLPLPSAPEPLPPGAAPSQEHLPRLSALRASIYGQSSKTPLTPLLFSTTRTPDYSAHTKSWYISASFRLAGPCTVYAPRNCKTRPLLVLSIPAGKVRNMIATGRRKQMHR